MAKPKSYKMGQEPVSIFESSPVVIVNPYKGIPRFSTGFTDIGNIPLTKSMKLPADMVFSVNVPLLGKTVAIPGSLLKRLHDPARTGLMKVRVGNITYPMAASVCEHPLVYTITARGMRSTIQKSVAIELVTNLLNIFPFATGELIYAYPEAQLPVILKITLMGLQHFLPAIVQVKSPGALVEVIMREPSSGREYKARVVATISEELGNTFDGGPITITTTDSRNTSVIRSAIDVVNFFDLITTYHIEGDIICAE